MRGITTALHIGICSSQTHSEDSQDLAPPPMAQLHPKPNLPSIAEEFEAWVQDAATRHKDAPSRYKGFEVLLDTYKDESSPMIHGIAPTGAYVSLTSPHPIIPPPYPHTHTHTYADTKSCSQALRYALKHPLVLPSANLSRPPTTGNYLLRKSSASRPTGPCTGTKVKELGQILHDMRERSSFVEASLGKETCIQVATIKEITTHEVEILNF